MRAVLCIMAIIGLFFLSSLIHAYRSDQARRALADAGYSGVEITGTRWLACFGKHRAGFNWTSTAPAAHGKVCVGDWRRAAITREP